MEDSSIALLRLNLNVQKILFLKGEDMEKIELQWGLIGLIGILLLVLGFYVLHLGLISFVGILLMLISLFFGYKDRKKVFT